MSPNLLCELDLEISEDFRRKLEISEGFRRKLEIVWGEALFGDDHDTVSRTPRAILNLHTRARTHRTVLQKHPLLRRGLGFRGVGELLPRTAGIFVVDVYKMLRFRFGEC